MTFFGNVASQGCKAPSARDAEPAAPQSEVLDAFMKVADEMIDVIVVGYPKSGTTWVTRLVAELVGCPVVGFLNSDHNEIAQEGSHRHSNFQCFKSHHQFYELCELKINPGKVIYVVRDPRDICISGSEYFHIERWPFLGKCFRKFPGGAEIYSGINELILSSSRYRVKRMLQAVVDGSKDINHWLRVPWVSHYKSYIENQSFFVKYEDILCDPESECKRIIAFLGISRDESQIKGAIERQSFENKKQEFLQSNQLNKAKFMQTGKKEQWRQGLSKRQRKMFSEMLTDELNEFGYPTFDNGI